MKNNTKWLLVFILCIALIGCGPEWKRKFVRRHTQTQPEQVFVYEPKEYPRASNTDLYQRSFSFWKAWQGELIQKLGNHKINDLRSFEEALKNLDEMKACLTDQKAAELEVYMKKLEAFYTNYKSEDFNIVQSGQMRQDLDRLMLRMDKQFRYSRIKEYIKQ